MRPASKILAGAAVALGVFTIGATAASAAIVCNREGECWHVRSAYHYKPAWGIVVHPNNWKWGATEHYTWREHKGRGYWSHGSWHRF